MNKTNHFNRWKVARRKWIKENPPTHEGYWFCVVGKSPLSIENMTLDHDISRSRDPRQRYNQDNLNPMCYKHNSDKQSKSLQQYLDLNPDMSCGLSSPSKLPVPIQIDDLLKTESEVGKITKGTSSSCPNGHLIARNRNCMWKGCKYNINNSFKKRKK